VGGIRSCCFPATRFPVMYGSSDAIPSIAALASDIRLSDDMRLLGSTILYYDHLITFSDEVDYIWNRPKTPSAYWFFLNRYFGLFSRIAGTIFSTVRQSSTSCKRFRVYRYTTLIVGHLIIAFLLTMRVYALYGRSLRVFAASICMAVVLSAIALWLMLGPGNYPVSLAGPLCRYGILRKRALRMAGVWEMLFIYDFVMFCLTMVKTWKTQRRHVTRIPLIHVIFRDGILFFGVIAMSILTNILTYYLWGLFLRGSLSLFSVNISTTMMSRIMLSLHKAIHTQANSHRTTSGTNRYSSSALSTGPIELDTLRSSDFNRRSMFSR